MEPQASTLVVRVFGTPQFFRLWIAQVVSSLGDWLGFLAVAVLATQVGASPDTAVAMVMAARLIPGFFLAPVTGVLVDRWPRKRVMVACDVGRAAVIACLPFVDSLASLVVASFVLELLTLLWAPAKEASVPSLVPADKLTSANSLSLAAAYGTFPLASLLFTVLAAISLGLADVSALDPLRLGREGSLAFYVDVATFLVAATLISRLPIPQRSATERARARRRHIDWAQGWHELKEGWHVIFLDPTVRAVTVGMALALVGGGMLVPLGPVFSVEVLDAGDAGFGVLLTALGIGGAAGIIGVNAAQRWLPHSRTFTGVLFGAAAALALGATFEVLAWVAVCVFVMGLCAGAAYVIGFTLLHEQVDDALLGRTFAGLFTLVRFCMLLAFVVGPFLSALLGRLADGWVSGRLDLPGAELALPGVRLALWVGAVVIVTAAVVASRSLATAARRTAAHPSRPVTEEAA